MSDQHPLQRLATQTQVDAIHISSTEGGDEIYLVAADGSAIVLRADSRIELSYEERFEEELAAIRIEIG